MAEAKEACKTKTMTITETNGEVTAKAEGYSSSFSLHELGFTGWDHVFLLKLA